MSVEPTSSISRCVEDCVAAGQKNGKNKPGCQKSIANAQTVCLGILDPNSLRVTYRGGCLNAMDAMYSACDIESYSRAHTDAIRRELIADLPPMTTTGKVTQKAMTMVDTAALPVHFVGNQLAKVCDTRVTAPVCKAAGKAVGSLGTKIANWIPESVVGAAKKAQSALERGLASQGISPEQTRMTENSLFLLGTLIIPPAKAGKLIQPAALVTETTAPLVATRSALIIPKTVPIVTEATGVKVPGLILPKSKD